MCGQTPRWKDLATLQGLASHSLDGNAILGSTLWVQNITINRLETAHMTIFVLM